MLPVAFIVALLLAGCGGGQGAQPSATKAQTRSSASRSATSPASTASTTRSSAAGAYWRYDKVVARLAGRTLMLPRGPVRLDPTLLECAGVGKPLKTGPIRRWSRYSCTQTLFKGGVDRDVTFEVEILNATRLTISSERYGAE